MIAHDVVGAIAKVGIIPVITVDDVGDAIPLGGALIAGGLPVLEITLRTEVGLAAIERLASRSDAVVGAGTVLDGTQVDAAVEAGARFVVSPGLHDEVVEQARRRGIVALPGIATPTELMAAARLGVDLVKFFPAEASGGVAAVRALSAIMPRMRFLPTGGIDETSAADYLALGSVVAVGGSWMAPKHVMSDGDWSAVEDAARASRQLTMESP